MNQKVCSHCKAKKSLIDFHKDRTRYDGYKDSCKFCMNKYNRALYKQNSQKYINKVLKQREQNKGVYLDYMADYGLQKNFDLSLVDYDKMLINQKECCAICGKHISEESKRFAVDHNHKTNEVRGLLCMSCNTKLGWYERQKENIEKYLGENK